MMSGSPIVLFENAEEAWFWFICAQEARNDGARYSSGAGNVIRPCEPVDILKIVDQLYRKRRLIKDHLLVLRHYGQRMMAPDARRVREKRAAVLWREAMDRLEPVLERKGIIEENSWLRRMVPQMDDAFMQQDIYVKHAKEVYAYDR